MRTSPLTKALLVAIPAGLWLALGHASLGQALPLVAGAVLVTWAWIELTAGHEVASAPIPAATPGAHRSRTDCRIPRTPGRRPARDLRCPASRATARARRSTRR
jgi:hypothetical protein